ncbi:hypothetical protein PFISCL1PPCAC_8754 [Pristionchus fissidentatus]|uniref:G protein-coupled receptor n=1 Tax=Pristionchus fissidentatus TaxID=1538716 RepID=A0AAV5VH62_9BILA|nr:hypothetical protein PFISCL1PPCAC_8754 [Pristionchus fissidentatus]
MTKRPVSLKRQSNARFISFHYEKKTKFQKFPLVLVIYFLFHAWLRTLRGAVVDRQSAAVFSSGTIVGQRAGGRNDHGPSQYSLAGSGGLLLPGSSRMPLIVTYRRVHCCARR